MRFGGGPQAGERDRRDGESEMTTTRAPWEMRWRDYYQALGVPTSATPEEIKSAFNAKARFCHPDAVRDRKEEVQRKADEEFKLLNEANEVLSDPDARKEYDRAYSATIGTPGASPPYAADGLRVEPTELVGNGIRPGDAVTLAFTLYGPSSVAAGSGLDLVAADSWLVVLECRSEQLGTDPLPAEVSVDLATSHLEPGETYYGSLVVRWWPHAESVQVRITTRPGRKGRTAPTVADPGVWGTAPAPTHDGVLTPSLLVWPLCRLGWPGRLLLAVVAPLGLALSLWLWAAGAIVNPGWHYTIWPFEGSIDLLPMIRPVTPAWAAVAVSLSPILILCSLAAVIETAGLTRPHVCCRLGFILTGLAVLGGMAGLAGAALVILWWAALLVAQLLVIAALAGLAWFAIWLGSKLFGK